MQTKTYYPSPALRPFISHYRVWKIEGSKDVMSLKDFPRTMMDMLFFFQGNVRLSIEGNTFNPMSSCAFVGHFDHAYQIYSSGTLEVFNIRFRPNGVYPLVRIPMYELLNQQAHLGDLINENVQEWQEQLAGEKSDSARIESLESWLLRLYQKSDLHHRLDYGIQSIQDCKGLISVQSLAQNLNTNYKSLDRWFNKNVGVSPKRFLQLTRFKSILDEIEQTNHTDWMQIVADYNFHDQAHFSKEFKQFAGVTPSQFKTELVNMRTISRLQT